MQERGNLVGGLFWHPTRFYGVHLWLELHVYNQRQRSDSPWRQETPALHRLSAYPTISGYGLTWREGDNIPSHLSVDSIHRKVWRNKPHPLVGKIEWWGTHGVSFGVMGNHCTVVGCTNCVGKKPGLRSIRFPSDWFFMKRAQWMDDNGDLKRKVDSARICNEHSVENHYY